MGWRDVEPSDEVHVADWLTERVRGFAVDVGSVVPSGFAAYARIFNPARMQAAGPTAPEDEVTWATVAAWNGKVVHPEMQFHSIGGPWHDVAQRLGPRVHEPPCGVLSRRQSAALVELLAEHTTTPASCWMCLWDGYGDLHPGGSVAWFAFEADSKPASRPPLPEPTYPPQVKRVRLPHREYLLFHGGVTQAVGWDQGPNLWWPEDRAWCVASEIDFPYTYVGGQAELIREILEDPRLESQPATLSDGITAVSDKING